MYRAREKYQKGHDCTHSCGMGIDGLHTRRAASDSCFSISHACRPIPQFYTSRASGCDLDAPFTMKNTPRGCIKTHTALTCSHHAGQLRKRKHACVSETTASRNLQIFGCAYSKHHASCCHGVWRIGCPLQNECRYALFRKVKALYTGYEARGGLMENRACDEMSHKQRKHDISRAAIR